MTPADMVRCGRQCGCMRVGSTKETGNSTGGAALRSVRFTP